MDPAQFLVIVLEDIFHIEIYLASNCCCLQALREPSGQSMGRAYQYSFFAPGAHIAPSFPDLCGLHTLSNQLLHLGPAHEHNEAVSTM